MIKIEETEVYGFEAAVRGMRNPLESWKNSDSYPRYLTLFEDDFYDAQNCGIIGKDAEYEPQDEPWHLPNGVDLYCDYVFGKKDLKLANKLAKAGNDHGKFARMITVTCDITAPLYWWKEFDTYRTGVEKNSCSTMHKIAAKEFTLDDFSCEKLVWESVDCLERTIICLNFWRNRFNESDEEREKYFNYNGYPDVPSKKECWWQMIQLLPSSYNQKRTVQLNYQVLCSMYQARKDHKLYEWKEFCKWCEALPYFREIFGIEKEV